MPQQRPVILLHGLWLDSFWMSGLSSSLARKGFAPHSLSYPSRDKTFARLVDEHLKPMIDIMPKGKIDFAAHSMGGLLVRLYARKYGTKRIGRVVMLGTPNNGSEMADSLRGLKAYQWYFGPAGQDLATAAAGFYDDLGPATFDCGVIAGTGGWMTPLTSLIANIPHPHDGLVSVASTRLDGMRGHVTLPVDHSMMVWDPAVWQLTQKFLDTGKF
jgi:triacylglycerol lipase